MIIGATVCLWMTQFVKAFYQNDIFGNDIFSTLFEDNIFLNLLWTQFLDTFINTAFFFLTYYEHNFWTLLLKSWLFLCLIWILIISPNFLVHFPPSSRAMYSIKPYICLINLTCLPTQFLSPPAWLTKTTYILTQHNLPNLRPTCFHSPNCVFRACKLKSHLSLLNLIFL